MAGDARYPGHDARGGQAEQVQDHPPALVNPIPSTRNPNPHTPQP